MSAGLTINASFRHPAGGAANAGLRPGDGIPEPAYTRGQLTSGIGLRDQLTSDIGLRDQLASDVGLIPWLFPRIG